MQGDLCERAQETQAVGGVRRQGADVLKKLDVEVHEPR